jgi:hypothetical protein
MTLIDQSQTTVRRLTTSVTTSSLAVNATYTGTITLPKIAAVLSITCSAQAWVRLYDSTTSQTNDSSRPLAQAPVSGSGVQFEVNTTSLNFSPIPTATNNQSPVSTSYPITITNTSSSTATITVTLTYISIQN